MPRMVQCQKLDRELPGVAYKPFDNELGQRIYDHISQDAWRMWIEHSKMLVNEYGLMLGTARAEQILLAEAERFFFGEGAERPPEFKPPSE